MWDEAVRETGSPSALPSDSGTSGAASKSSGEPPAWEAVDSSGNIKLHPLCAPPTGGDSWIGLYLWMTHPDEVKRPTALEAMTHPWLRDELERYKEMDEQIRKEVEEKTKKASSGT